MYRIYVNSDVVYANCDNYDDACYWLRRAIKEKVWINPRMVRID